jgi:hypothetical protein
VGVGRGRGLSSGLARELRAARDEGGVRVRSAVTRGPPHRCRAVSLQGAGRRTVIVRPAWSMWRRPPKVVWTPIHMQTDHLTCKWPESHELARKKRWHRECTVAGPAALTQAAPGEVDGRGSHSPLPGEARRRRGDSRANDRNSETSKAAHPAKAPLFIRRPPRDRERSNRTPRHGSEVPGSRGQSDGKCPRCEDQLAAWGERAT